METRRRLRDPRELRALAHPVRLAILEQVRLHGPLTASQLGERIDETPANCSWHLRKLAEHGFVEEAGGGRGRQRPWRATSLGMTWGEPGDSPEVQIAGEVLSQVLLEREVARFAAARACLPDDSAAWQEAAFTSQTMLWLTADELAEINRVVTQFFTEGLDRHEDPAKRPEGARLCALVSWGAPTYDDTAATGGAPV